MYKYKHICDYCDLKRVATPPGAARDEVEELGAGGLAPPDHAHNKNHENI